MSKITFVVEKDSAGGYFARALGFSIFTQADSIEELKEMAQDAVRCHFDDAQIQLTIIFRGSE